MSAREEKIKNAMSRMADTVIKKSKNATYEEELRYLEQCNEKDRQDELREKSKKDAARKRDLEIRKTLANQMSEKRQYQ